MSISSLRPPSPRLPAAAPLPALDPAVSYEGKDLDAVRREYAAARRDADISRLAILAVEHFPGLIDQARAALAANTQEHEA
jgi:hypothetical protein